MEVAGGMELKGSAQRTAKLAEAARGMEDAVRPAVRTGKAAVAHVSRLQCLQIAIEEQIARIARENPDKNVGLVSFNSEVVLLGDGEQDPLHVTGDRLNSWEELQKVAGKYKLEKSVKEAQESLVKKLWDLEEDGATALGPALLLGIALAGTAPGSSVILCTDGLANQGLGSLEGKDKEFVAFYNECAEQAVLKGVSVSVLSLQGAECKLESLSVVAEKTSGSVERVDPRALVKQMNALVGAPSIISYGVMAMVLLHRGLRFQGEFDDEQLQRFWVVKDLGNVTAASECTFSYNFRSKEECDLSALREIPFQVQLLFTRPDNSIYLRVATATVSVTEDRLEAEKQANATVVGAHAAQHAARLAKEGKYEQAQLEARAAARFLERAGVEQTKLDTFKSQVDQMDGVLRQERKKEKESDVSSAKKRKAARGDEAAVVISQATQFTTDALFS
jgi:hypothetical protein